MFSFFARSQSLAVVREIRSFRVWPELKPLLLWKQLQFLASVSTPPAPAAAAATPPSPPPSRDTKAKKAEENTEASKADEKSKASRRKNNKKDTKELNEIDSLKGIFPGQKYTIEEEEEACFQEALKWAEEQRQDKFKKIETFSADIKVFQEEIKLHQEKFNQVNAETQQLICSRLRELNETISRCKSSIKRIEDSLRRSDPDREKKYFHLRKQLGVKYPDVRLMPNDYWKDHGEPRRIYNEAVNLKVVGDVIPTKFNFLPSINFSVEYPSFFANKGTSIKPSLSLERPHIKFDSEQQDKRFAISMIDADAPHLESKSLQESVHWLVFNLPSQVNVGPEAPLPSSAVSVIDYIPPHPEKGTGVHRYVFVLYEQTKGLLSNIEPLQNDRFISNMKIIEKYDLKPVGLAFMRAEWDTSVAATYRKIFGKDEPYYGFAGEAEQKLKTIPFPTGEFSAGPLASPLELAQDVLRELESKYNNKPPSRRKGSKQHYIPLIEPKDPDAPVPIEKS